jgi:hypothetical protein
MNAEPRLTDLPAAGRFLPRRVEAAAQRLDSRVRGHDGGRAGRGPSRVARCLGAAWARRLNVVCLAGLAVLAALAPSARAEVAGFDDLPLPPNSYFVGVDENPAPGEGTESFFTSGAATFNHYYDAEWFYWDGWTYTNVGDFTTPGYMNQYSAYVAPAPAAGEVGRRGSSNYAVAYNAARGISTVEVPDGIGFEGAWITNTTYAYLAVRDGDDGVPPEWGGPYVRPFTTGDWFKLTIFGVDALGQDVGAVEFYLADYRSYVEGIDLPDDFIVHRWTYVDLSSLAGAVRLEFELDSTDTTEGWGINTPSYFALDDLVTSPAVPLVWAGGDGLWGGANWQGGAGQSSPAGGEAMVVAGGMIVVEGSFTGELAAASLRVEGESAGVHVAPSAALEVQAAVNVSHGAVLAVDGLLDAGVLIIHGADPQSGSAAGTLSGVGTIQADRVVIGGVLSPGSLGGGAVATEFPHSGDGAHAVPEPAATALLLAAALLVLAGAGRRRPAHRRGA